MLQITDGGAPGSDALGVIDAGRLGASWQGRIDGNNEPPPPPPPPPPAPLRRLQVDLVDEDGVVWDLMQGPVRMTAAGLEGLGVPTGEWHTSEAPGVDGQRVTGWRLKARDVFLPMRFKGTAEGDATGLQRAWWDAIAIDRHVVLRVTDHEGSVREIRMRLKDDGGVKYRRQPYIIQPDALGLTFTADDPWWYGSEVRAGYQFTSEEGVDFFGGDEQAPDFQISAGAGTSGRLKLRNPGDAPAAVYWEVTGSDAQSFSITVGTHVIALSQPIVNGSVLALDTDPRQLTARLDGALYPFRQFDAIDFAMIPKRTEQPVLIQLVGTGMILGRLRPRYFRGF